MTNPNVQSADHYMTVKLISVNQEQLKSMMRNFAAENSMSFASAVNDPDKNMETIELKSRNLIISAVNPFDERVYDIASYNNRPETKYSPSTTDLMNALHAKLKEAGGVEISVQY